MIYSRLDVNLALFVAGWRGQERRTSGLAALENTPFKRKLELVMPAVVREHGQRLDCITDWLDWLCDADRLRCTRNDLMHGRWGIYETHGMVCNIVGLPGSAQREVVYSLSDLADEVENALEVSERFSELSRKWPS